METRVESLLAEMEALKHECGILHERASRLEEENETLRKDLEKQKRNFFYADGRAEAYAHCIDAMNGIKHEKKVGFRNADG